MSETDDLRRSAPGTAGEANEADAAEQRTPLGEGYGERYGEGLDEGYGEGFDGGPAEGSEAGERPREWYAQVPDEVNEADAVEQRHEVPLDEDDYR